MIKKYLFRIVSAVLFFSVISAFSILPIRLNSTVSAVFNGSNKTPPTIILDAGHGGEDGGAEASDGTLEKDINLSIVLKLKDMLLQSGFEVTAVREEDISVGNQKLSTVRERKASDLKTRLEIFNNNENNVVLSIHQNKFEEPQYCGAQIFYSANNPQSSVLAESIRNSITSLLQPENNRECKKADENIYVLNNAVVPAVIVECGFLSNPKELENLKQEEYQLKTAFSIYLGFLQYYAENWT